MADLTDIVGTGPVLVLAPHPDDESLGCGALLAACWAATVPAHVACLTDGAASHPGSALWPPRRLTTLRRDELIRAITLLGGDPKRDLTVLGFPDGRLHEVELASLVEAIDALIEGSDTKVVIAPSPLDRHCDHIATARAADLLAARSPGLRFLSYPIWSRWEALPGHAPQVPGTVRHRFDGSAFTALKAQAIGAHASQRGLVIGDAPEGFAMPAGFADLFADSPEIFDERTS